MNDRAQRTLIVLLILLLGTAFLNSNSQPRIPEAKALAGDCNLTPLYQTFLGSMRSDTVGGLARGKGAEFLIAGSSSEPWGNPIRPHQGLFDAVVIKIDPQAQPVWHTFLGSSGSDYAQGVVLDAAGNAYVVGYGSAWGTPDQVVRPHSGLFDAFVAKLNGSGQLQWVSFLGSNALDYGTGIAMDGSGNLYITGYSEANWGSSARPFAGTFDAFVAKVNSNGILQWNTLLGGTNVDYGYAIVSDAAGNVTVAGESWSSWGSPIRGASGDADAFLARLNTTGGLVWNTFLGAGGSDSAYALGRDATTGALFIAGFSSSTWETPTALHSGGLDGFVAKTDSAGNYLWNTFMGSAQTDVARGLGLSASGEIFVIGDSNASWGSPSRIYTGKLDAFVARLSSTGQILQNFFFGSALDDYGYALILDEFGQPVFAGESEASWGTPVNAFVDPTDIFWARGGCWRVLIPLILQ